MVAVAETVPSALNRQQVQPKKNMHTDPLPLALCQLLCVWGAAPLGLGCRGAAPQTDILRHPNRREVHRALEAMTPTSRASHSSVMLFQLHVAGILFLPTTHWHRIVHFPTNQQTKGPAHTYGVEQFPLMPAYSNRLQFPGRTITGKAIMDLHLPFWLRPVPPPISM